MMEVSSQIKKYRTSMNLSQEDLAEKVFAMCQTISNWEYGKNYPDIHSFLLLGAVFDASLDLFIKGDIRPMEEEISKSERLGFRRDSAIFSLLVLFVVSVIPLGMILHHYGYMVSAVIYVAAIYYAVRIERHKKG